jgi:hypothetical protein
MTSRPKPPQSQAAERSAKLDRPGVYFKDPIAVHADPGLTEAEKARVLATLEQDARQLQIASGEGMSNGEPNRLRDVRLARLASLRRGTGRKRRD